MNGPIGENLRNNRRNLDIQKYAYALQDENFTSLVTGGSLPTEIINVNDPFVNIDIDTMEDYEKFKKRSLKLKVIILLLILQTLHQ